jgi:protein SCO1/2
MKHLLFILLLALGALIVNAQTFSPVKTGNSALSADELKSVGIEQRLGDQIPAGLVFTDSTGEKIDLSALAARKPTLLALVYYNCPNLCTLVLNGMVSSLEDLRRPVGDGFQVIVVSIDPTETPALAAQKKATYLLRYSKGHRQAQEWSFLIGDQTNISRLADAVGYHYRYDPTIHQFAHGSGLVMLDSSGRITQYFLGIEYPPLEIEKSIQLAQAGRTGSPVEQFLLLCYCYNPLTGPYGFIIFTVIKILAGLTVATLAAYIIWHIRRETLAGREA